MTGSSLLSNDPCRHRLADYGSSDSSDERTGNLSNESVYKFNSSHANNLDLHAVHSPIVLTTKHEVLRNFWRLKCNLIGLSKLLNNLSHFQIYSINPIQRPLRSVSIPCYTAFYFSSAFLAIWPQARKALQSRTCSAKSMSLEHLLQTFPLMPICFELSWATNRLAFHRPFPLIALGLTVTVISLVAMSRILRPHSLPSGSVLNWALA